MNDAPPRPTRESPFAEIRRGFSMARAVLAPLVKHATPPPVDAAASQQEAEPVTILTLELELNGSSATPDTALATALSEAVLACQSALGGKPGIATIQLATGDQKLHQLHYRLPPLQEEAPPAPPEDPEDSPPP